jgi:hypothetical protein
MFTLLCQTVQSLKTSLRQVLSNSCRTPSQAALFRTPEAIAKIDDARESVSTTSSKRSVKRRLDLTDEAIVGVPSGKKMKATSPSLLGMEQASANREHDQPCIFSIHELVAISLEEMTPNFKAVANVVSSIDFSPLYASALIVYNACRQTMGHRGGPRDVVKEFARFILLKSAITRCDVCLLKPTCVMNAMWRAASSHSEFYSYLKNSMHAYGNIITYETSPSNQDNTALCRNGLSLHNDLKTRDIPLRLLYAVYKTYVGCTPLSVHAPRCEHESLIARDPPIARKLRRFSKHQKARRRRRFMKFTKK